MADRYWVGGAGNWDATTTHWSATSGGAGGASVPTATDNVIIDQAGPYTITITVGARALNFTISAANITIANSAGNLWVYGNFTLDATTVWPSMSMQFNGTGTKTITTNGVTLKSAPLYFNNDTLAGTFNLGSALTNEGTVYDVTSTINTNGYALSTTANSGITLNGGVINFSTSTVTSQGFPSLDIRNSAYTTASAGGVFIATSSAGSMQSTSTVRSTIGEFRPTYTGVSGQTITITGPITTKGMLISGCGATGFKSIAVAGSAYGNLIIDGNLATTGTAGNSRINFWSSTYGIGYTVPITSSTGMSDVDFRDIYVTGGTISGTRIGNRGNCTGITFSTPKTVYWNLAAGGSWTDNAWATSSGGAVSTNNFPLPQDTATIVNTGLATSNSISLSSFIPYTGTVDMSARTNAMVFSFGGGATTAYGNWITGSGTSYLNANTLTFSGGGTQTITSAGKTFSCPITVDTYGGTVQLADALNMGTGNLTVTNGTFNTQGYAVAAGSLSSSNSNVRTINLGASTLTLISATGINMGTVPNLTFNAGTSSITINSGNSDIISGGLTFYNVTIGVNASIPTISGVNTFNNLTYIPLASGIKNVAFSANQTINGTLTCAGASAVSRIYLRSGTIGTRQTLTVNAWSASPADVDFRDIALTGAVGTLSGTRFGDCGNNSGITFDAPKTVYWNLAGSQNWSATGWATSSGGSPAINNFPLAQDTAVFDNTGAISVLTMEASWNIGTFDASARTSAMSFNFNSTFTVYGDWKFGTGLSMSASVATVFAKNGTQTITSNGVQFVNPVTINNPNAYVQLADALSLASSRAITLTTGTFDAVTYNVTAGQVINSATSNILKMGSGTWTLSGTGTVWSMPLGGTLIAGTATIVLSDTSTTARTFAGGNLYYNKLTIGGTTGTSTLAITGANTFGELASTKTVAHTISLPATTNNFGKWSVTGTAGNLVTINASTTSQVIYGPAVTGVDYLSITNLTILGVSPGEFYAGANSVNVSGNTNVIFTAAPSPRTLYWVGGTGNWSSTTKWSTASGGVSGAAIPTSLDTVVFDSASNATAYTATIDAGVTIARCAAFTLAGPASGNVSLSGTVALAVHGNMTTAATGITANYFGTLYLVGASGGSYTLTDSGGAMLYVNDMYFYGFGSWTLGSAVTIGAGKNFFLYAGSLNTNGYTVTSARMNIQGTTRRTLTLGASNIVNLTTGFTVSSAVNFTFNADTSTVTQTTAASGSLAVPSTGLTFYNVSFPSTSLASVSISGANTFNNLTIAGLTSVGVTAVTFSANQTINGTLTLGAGTAAAYRTFLASDTIGTQRTLTCAAISSLTDVDFRDINFAGAISLPVTGTRFGDCKGNSGITFPAAKTVYYRQTSTNTWATPGSGSWSATSGGALDATMFPLAQDTAVFPAATYPASGSTTTINNNFNIGTIDMSLRTSNTMTLATGTNTPQIYGNWINGTGTTLSGTGNITFAGRASQTITSAGVTFTQPFTVNTPSGSVTLQDAFTTTYSGGSSLNSGTFNANGYNVTISGAASQFTSATSNARTLAIGSGTWTIAGSNGYTATSTNLTVTGTGTISFTSATAKTFTGGGVNYSGITLNQGGAGTLTISGNNTFANITNTYGSTGATTISLGSSTQTVGAFTAAGTSGKLLTITGTSAASPATIVYSGGGTISGLDYLIPTFIRAYPTTATWYAGANSTNGGSLGWIFTASGGVVYAVYITEAGTASQTTAAAFGAMTYSSNIAEMALALDSIAAAAVFRSAVVDTGTASQTAAAAVAFVSAVSNTANATDTTAARATFGSAVSNIANATDTTASRATFGSAVSNTANATDTTASRATFGSAVSNTANATDSIASKEVFRSSIADTANATDTTASRATFGSSVSNTANATDTTASRATFGSAVSNTANATDSIAASETLRPAISEQANASQTNSAAQRFVSAVSNTANASQTNSATAVFNGAVTATVNVSDSPSAKEVFGSSVSNTVTVTDTASTAQRFGTSISEQATASQTNAAAQRFGTTISEQATASQTNAATQAFNSNATAQATAHDAISTSAMFAGYVTETATGSETDSAKAVFGSAVDNSITIDATNAAQAIFRTNIADTVQVSDQSAAVGALRGYITETSTAHDVDAVAASTFNAAATATATASQTNAAKAAFGAAVSNTANASDSDVGRIRFPGGISESATALDSIAAAQRFRTAITEANQASNIFAAIETFKSTVSNTVRASQTAASQATFGSAVSNTANASQTNAAKATFGAAFDGSATASDSDVGFISFPGAVTEAAQASEQDAAQAVFIQQVTDGAAASEFVATNFQVNAAATATAQASDTAATSQVANSAVAESATANSTAATRAIFQGIISEAVQGSDRFDTTAVFLAAFSEFAQAYAADVGYLTGSRAVSESSTASATNAAVGALRGYISESATGNSTNSALFFHATYINESAAGTDSVDAAGSVYNAAVTNTVQAVDAVTAGAIFYAAVMAYAGITDVATARYLWELIDDRQTPDWGTINDTQSAGWVEVNDIQAASWQNVGNTQADGWTQIDDTQNPNWGRITP